MEELFKETSQRIRIYLGKETINDPYTKEKTTVLFPPIYIDAIVYDLTMAQVQWKLPGVSTNQAKTIIIRKAQKNTLLNSIKIRIDSIDYVGWRLNGKLQYKVEGDFIRAHLYYYKKC